MCYAMSSRPKEWATQQSRWKTRHRVSRKQVVRCEQETKVRSHVSFGKCCQGVFVLLACCMCCSFGLLCLGVCLSLSLSLSLFPSFLSAPPPPKALKDGHGTTARAIRHAGSPQRVRRRAQGFARHHSESAPTRPIPAEGSSASSRIRTAPHRSPQRVRRRAIRHARSPQRVRRRAQGFARHHSESAPTRPIPAEGSPASDPTRPIPVEGSSASSRMRTAPQRERSDTPDPCRGFIGHGKDAHGTTPIPAEGSPASDPTRPIPVEGSSATARMRTAPQRERSDTPDPCRGFIGHGKDAHGTTPIPAEGSQAIVRHARSL